MHFEEEYTYHIYNHSNETLFHNCENYLFFLNKSNLSSLLYLLGCFSEGSCVKTIRRVVLQFQVCHGYLWCEQLIPAGLTGPHRGRKIIAPGGAL